MKLKENVPETELLIKIKLRIKYFTGVLYHTFNVIASDCLLLYRDIISQTSVLHILRKGRRYQWGNQNNLQNTTPNIRSDQYEPPLKT